ncbi:MAG: HAD-IIB family hydrolase, partial [Lachnospiraceae bacterium]|nr:HAD-IIB family hydrolase [Lachnospiraceae bacterium]
LIHAEEGCIYSKAFSIEDTNRIVRSVKARMPGTEISVAHGKTVFWNSLHIAESERLHKAVYNDYSRDLEVGANKIAAVLAGEQMAQEIADEIGCKLQCYRGENMYAFLPEGSGKIQAIEALSERSGIAISDIVAFGDDKNDIDMLTMCGKGVAVANAIPEVLAVADEITASNDEDGVAEWMRKNCLS